MTIRLLDHKNRKPSVAFVLGGGGNLGAIQVGQLRALAERGIVPDVVIGCSVGALNACAIAGNPTIEEVERLDQLWSGLSRQHIFPSSRLSRGPWVFLKNGLSAFPNSGLRKVIEHWKRFDLIEDAIVPLMIVATSVRTGLERWFTSGSLTDALLASTALPGIFPPVEIDGERFVDGGVVNNVPVSKAIELGARDVYVLDVGSIDVDPTDPHRPYEVLLQAVGIAHSHRFRSDLESVPRGVRLHRLPAVSPGKLRYDDFSRSAELMSTAHRAASKYLDDPDRAFHAPAPTLPIDQTG